MNATLPIASRNRIASAILRIAFVSSLCVLPAVVPAIAGCTSADDGHATGDSGHDGFDANGDPNSRTADIGPTNDMEPNDTAGDDSDIREHAPHDSGDTDPELDAQLPSDIDAGDSGDVTQSPDAVEPDVEAEPDADTDEPEPCPPLSHDLPRDTRTSYNLGYNPNYPASSTEMVWFDEPGGQISQNMSLLRDHFAALEFTTGDQALGSTQFEATSLVATPGSTILALSKCPGQFTDLSQWCVNTGYLAGLGWSVGYPAEEHPFSCPLETDSTYFLNIAHAPSPTVLDESSCADPDRCGSVFSHSGTSD